jgi:hypothetical protein
VARLFLSRAPTGGADPDLFRARSTILPLEIHGIIAAVKAAV